ncbi:hypothetical protein HNY42_15520 [Exiguobacterium sp. Helios]|uniref:hypothetical protein n=1 Tax=Exiguobacterium sp. Helios TaxID=2735868 RepID=UPI00165DFB52|nr:hypothetical protein [Exiguobacterium sp. Helios]QNR22296.1 hypothetical protein HNY42_15520 [Exiguobacterium sp. Helios]
MSQKIIGIVSEGPRDFDVFNAIIEHLSPNTFRCIPIHPVQSETSGFGSHGAGWKGVLSWCSQFNSNEDIETYLNSFQPSIDALIIHIDADIARESEINCYQDCENMLLTIRSLTDLLKNHMSINESDSNERIIFCIPSDNTEAWILCAFSPELDNPPDSIIECINKPDLRLATHPLSLLKLKNGKPKKSANKYLEILIPKMISEWDVVKEKCTQANQLSDNILSL